MNKILLASVAAAALAATSGFAVAQSPEPGASSAPSMKSETSGESRHDAGRKSHKDDRSAQTGTSHEDGARRAEGGADRDRATGDRANATTSSSTAKSAQTDSDRNANGTRDRDRAADRTNDKDRADRKEDRAERNAGERREDRAGVDADHDKTAGRLDPDKRERISETIRRDHVAAIKDVDFNIRVGAMVPPRHHARPLPTELVSIFPQYRGYDYLVANDEIIIIEPQTHKIVYTMQEGRSAGMDRPSTGCR